MKFIYGWARNVYVWLGDTEFPGRLDEISLQHKPLEPDAVAKALRSPERSPSRAFRTFVYMLSSALQQMSPPWHTRAWVYQEHHLARNIIWCMGPYQQKYTKHAFARLTQLATQFQPSIILRQFQDAVVPMSHPFTQYGVSTYGWFHEDSPLKSTGIKLSLHTHAAIAQRMCCRYTVDKVYSLLGVIDTRPWANMRPDYSKSSSWVFAEATWLSLELGNDYDCFLNARGPASPAVLVDIPSWTFDYERGIFYTFPKSLTSVFEVTLRVNLPKASPRLSDDHRELRLTGLVLTSVAHVGQELMGPGTPPLSTHKRFIAMAGALAAYEEWQLTNHKALESQRTARPPWPPANGYKSFTDQGEFPIDADAWKSILLSKATHVPLSVVPVEWASCITAFITDDGHWALMTGPCSLGDAVFVVKDCPYPLILRKQGEVYEFRGCAYIAAYSTRERHEADPYVPMHLLPHVKLDSSADDTFKNCTRHLIVMHFYFEAHGENDRDASD